MPLRTRLRTSLTTITEKCYSWLDVILKMKKNLCLFHQVFTTFSMLVYSVISRHLEIKTSQSMNHNSPAGTRRWINVGLTLVRSGRRWTNVKPTLIQRLVSAGRAQAILYGSDQCYNIVLTLNNWYYNVHFAGQLVNIDFILDQRGIVPTYHIWRTYIIILFNLFLTINGIK